MNSKIDEDILIMALVVSGLLHSAGWFSLQRLRGFGGSPIFGI